MDIKSQIILLLADKLILGIIVLIASLSINKNLEIFKNDLARQNKVNDKRFEKIALVVEKIWDCKRAFERLATNNVKRTGEGPFTDIAELIEEDPDFKMQLEWDYHESIDDFGTAVSELKATVDSSGFGWVLIFCLNHRKLLMAF